MYIGHYKNKKDITFQEFYNKYCLNCDKDKNKDADPICLHLDGMMEGKSPPKECEGKKK